MTASPSTPFSTPVSSHTRPSSMADKPLCMPMLYARIGDSVFLHGSSASRTMRILASGAPASLAVTLADGLVLARSAFHHSANYRSVVLMGACQAVIDADERMQAFEAFTN